MTRAYETSAAHLRDELARIDLLVRAQVVRWRRTIAAAKPAQLWGMVQVSDAEIDQYFATDPAAPGGIPEALEHELRPYWKRETEAAADIRLAVGETKIELRVEQLRKRFGLSDAELDVVLIALLARARSSLPAHLRLSAGRRLARVAAGRSHRADAASQSADARGEDGAVRAGAAAAAMDAHSRCRSGGAHRCAGCFVFDGARGDGGRAGGAHSTPIVLHGSEGSGRMRAAREIANGRGMGLLRYDAVDDPAQAFREARLQNAALYFANAERLEPAQLDALIRTAETMQTLTFLAKDGGVESAAEARCERRDFGVPHYEERRALWEQQLPESDDRPQRAAKLASAFQFTPGQIRDANEIARVRNEDPYTASRRLAGHRLAGFARRIEPEPQLNIESVVLPRPNKVQLRELRDRVRLRPRLPDLKDGLVVLFAGPSGTGKTFAAKAIASEQGVDLYKVDASAIVSKWVGETEKNLSRVFADAEGSDALLFFDECDSLFGQRGEISDAQDRWANLQVNYLLQRVEEYPGVIILATNLRSNIDDAFARRIRMIVEFPVPDAALRVDLWKRSVAGWKGLDEEELRAVAERFSLTGGSIRNVAVESMFRALAKDRETLVVRDVIASIAREYQKHGRPVTKGRVRRRVLRVGGRRRGRAMSAVQLVPPETEPPRPRLVTPTPEQQPQPPVPIARAPEILAKPEEAPDVAARAKLSVGLQQQVGNARVGEMAITVPRPGRGSGCGLGRGETRGGEAGGEERGAGRKGRKSRKTCGGLAAKGDRGCRATNRRPRDERRASTAMPVRSSDRRRPRRKSRRPSRRAVPRSRPWARSTPRRRKKSSATISKRNFARRSTKRRRSRRARAKPSG